MINISREFDITTSRFSKVISFPPKNDGLIAEFKTDLMVKDITFVMAPWQSWSDWIPEKIRTIGRQTAKIFFKDILHGIEPYGKNVEKCDKYGRSYNFISFSEYFIGIVPDFNSIAVIECRADSKGKLVVSLKKEYGKSNQKQIPVEVVITRGLKIEESLNIYKKKISKPGIPLMKNRRIGFSWPFYGVSVTQEKIEKEIESAAAYVDSYVIDHGYQENCLNGDWDFDQSRFPDIPKMIKVFKKNKIIPGIWVAPFLASSNSKIYKNHPEYFLRSQKGGLIEDSRWWSPDKDTFFPKKNYVFDISKKEVRDYLLEIFMRLYDQGFRLFKLDFLHAIFGHNLCNKIETPIKYYREFFITLRETLGSDVEFIGCGAPLMESVGLFEGMRFTNDSAMLKLAGFDKLGLFFKIFNWTFIPKKINDYMYKNAMKVGLLNFLNWKNLHGLILDGIHLAEEQVAMSVNIRREVNELYSEYRKIGGTNIFIGDSLAETENNPKTKEMWTAFLSS